MMMYYLKQILVKIQRLLKMNKQTIQTIAHRTCRKYKHNSPIPTDLTKAEYTFDEDTLVDFVEKILKEKDE